MIRLEGVPDEGRGDEARRLLEEGDDRILDERRQRRGADRGERREQQPVGQPAPEARLLRILVVVMDRMRVARHTGKEHEVGVGQRARRATEAVAHGEVLEEELLHHARVTTRARTSPGPRPYPPPETARYEAARRPAGPPSTRRSAF